MVERANERTAYFNGRYLPESEVVIPFRDRGFKYGEAVFDTARTFGHELRQMDEHIRRLYRSLAYIGIDSRHTAAEFHEITQEVVKRNRHLVADDEDYWVFIRVTPGSGDPFFGDAGDGPTVIVDCTPIPFAARAPLFSGRHHGCGLVVPPHRAVGAQPARQDAELSQPDDGRPRSQAAKRRGLGDPVGRERQPVRMPGQQHLRRARRPSADAKGALRPARRPAGPTSSGSPASWASIAARPTSISMTPTAPTKCSCPRPACAWCRSHRSMAAPSATAFPARSAPG